MVFHHWVNSDFTLVFCNKIRENRLKARGNQKLSTNQPERKSWINEIIEIPIQNEIINLSKEREKKLTFKLFKIKRPVGTEQKMISPQRKMIEIIIKIVIVYNFKYVILFLLCWWSIQDVDSMLENHNKIKIDQEEIRLEYS